MFERIRLTLQEVIGRKTDKMDSANQDYSLPEAHGVIDGISRGRVVREGYQRGWGLQFGGLKQKILDDPLYQQAAGDTAGRMAHFSEHNRMNMYLLLRFFLPRIPFGHIIEFGSFRGKRKLMAAYRVGSA